MLEHFEIITGYLWNVYDYLEENDLDFFFLSLFFIRVTLQWTKEIQEISCGPIIQLDIEKTNHHEEHVGKGLIPWIGKVAVWLRDVSWKVSTSQPLPKSLLSICSKCPKY